MQFNVLGPLEVSNGGAPLALGGPKQRAVLAVLVLNANRTVPADQIVDAVWGDEAHDRAGNTLQVYISNLRKALEPDVSGGAYQVLVRQAPGYQLVAPTGTVDLERFETAVAEARRLMAGGDPERAGDRLREGLAIWRGDALADLASEGVIQHERTRLAELRTSALEDRIDADLACGRSADVVADIEALVREHPFRERLRGQLMLALYRSGRQADALRAYAATRECLLDELGIDPGAPLQELEQAILRQDPMLDGEDASAAANASDGSPASEDQEQVIPTRRMAPGDSGLGILLLPGNERYVLSSAPCTVGRVAACTVTLPDPNISRRHAVIRLVDGAFVLSDLGSTNGTSVNGTPVTERVLEPDDEISLGDTTIRFDRP